MKLSRPLKEKLIKLFGIYYYNIRNAYISIRIDFKRSLVGIIMSKKRPYEINQLKFFFPKNSLLFHYGSSFSNYELPERVLIKKYISRENKILEIGACVGVTSCFSNKLLENKQNHVVLEPNPNMLGLLNKNKELNSSLFKIEEGILSLKKTEKLYFGPDYLGSSVLNQNSLNDSLKVKTFSIEKLSFKYNIIFDTLIMDIEGAEVEVLSDFELSSFNKIIAEFHPRIYGKVGYEKCVTQLEKKHFKFMERIENVEYWKKTIND